MCLHKELTFGCVMIIKEAPERHLLRSISLHYVSTTRAQLKNKKKKTITSSYISILDAEGQGVVFTQAYCEHDLCIQLETHRPDNAGSWQGALRLRSA